MNKIQISQKRLDKGIYWERSLELVPGCSPVSEGCIECWSARQTHMRSKQKNPKIRERYAGLTDEKGNWTGEIRLREDLLDLPLRVKKPTVWAIWNDLFHEKVPNSFIDKTISVIHQCQNDNMGHVFIALTKRIERMCNCLRKWSNKEYRNNLWLGVTAENQRTADERIPILLQIPAAVRFLSIEPMLDRINLDKYLFEEVCIRERQMVTRDMAIDSGEPQREGEVYSEPEFVTKPSGNIHWVIVGAESGPKKRYCHNNWITDLKVQCQYAGIPLFVKQIHTKGWLACIDKLVKDINKFPEDLRIREFPKCLK